ncbi:MFS transporter [Winogradskya humida]|uniref:MFS transporter n=1 Tax=Winogradskya humida TaxID=113566 RepID=A0ABQ3ZRP9_9ACTN|nr:MFS transporter [Actinoplanes humidus]GIE21250.1 MFS transporter [Actinoplanes humidus]
MILRPPFLLTTVGSWCLVFLAAFEAMAVTTVMPQITADLNGRDLYAVAFSAALAAGVVGMVGFGSWADRRGPTVPLLVSIVVFAAGLIVAGTASSMPVFVAGRFLQGLGAGGDTVALYVLVAAVYPTELHIKIFGAFAGAWVIPSMVGPFVAGLVATALSWHWVFLGVVLLVAIATIMVLPSVRGRDKPPADRTPMAAADWRRLARAVVVAVSVVAVSSYPIVLVVAGFALVGLLPKGTYRAKPGLPASVLLVGVAAGIYYGTDVYLPLLLQERYGLPTWLSGITLTTGALAWAGASAIQARLADRVDPGASVRLGAVLLASGAAVELVTVILHLSPFVAAAGWLVAGAGMGTLFPRISTLVLAYSKPGEEGFNTGAKSITDAVGGSASLAVAGLLFSAAPFVGPFAFTTLLGLAAILISRRVMAPVPVAV